MSRKLGAIHFEPFSKREMSLLQLFATWIGGEIHRRDVQAKLRKTDKNFSALIENFSSGIYIHRHFRPLYANQTLLEMLGFESLEEFLSLESTELLLAPEERERIRGYHEARLANKPAPRDYEFRALKKDGTAIPVDNLSFTIDWGDQTAVCTTLFDLTGREEDKQVLQMKEQLLLDAVESISDGVVLFDANDRLVLSNSATRNDLKVIEDLIVPGAKYEDIVRGIITKVDIGPSNKTIDERVHDVLQFNEYSESPIYQQEANGRWIMVNEIKTKDGGTFVTRTNITELKQAKDMAEAASLAKTTFLASASHDLRQPLQAINLFVGMLRGIHDNVQRSVVVEKLEGSITDITNLLNVLLDIANLESGLVKPEQSACAVNDIFSFADELMPVARSKSIDLRIVPSSAVIRTDPTLLKSILRNFAENALKYTETGKVLIGCRRRGANLAIEVWDTGIGFDDATLHQVFDDYYQANNPSRDRSQGLGLGLAIVKRQAGLLGHKLTCSTKINRGSVFGIEVPIDSQAYDTDRGLTETKPTDLPPSLVVLIDDDASVLAAMSMLISTAGHEVVTANFSKEFDMEISDILASCKRTPDFIIADFRLPAGRRGPEVVAELRRQFETIIPAIILTGDVSGEIQIESLDKNISLLYKPVRLAKLREVMAESVSVH